MKKYILLSLGALFYMCFLPQSYFAQNAEDPEPTFAIGANLSTGLNWAEENSQYFYNGIHPRRRNLTLGVEEFNLLASWRFQKRLSFHSRLQLRRDDLGELKNWALVQAHLRYTSKKGRSHIDIGRFIMPIGSFFRRVLPQDRLLIGFPLPYNFYVNVSDQVGYSPALQEPERLILADQRDWGLPLLYPFGYNNGVKFHSVLKADTLELDLAITQSAPSTWATLDRPIRPNIMGRIQYQPTFFWRQGLSFSYGPYLGNNSIGLEVDKPNQYRQFLIGTDVRLGYSYFEFNAELMASHFSAPLFDNSNQEFIENPGFEPNLWTLGGYMDIKAEAPFWPGLYLAYRWGFLNFNTLENQTSDWDRAVNRHSIGIGIKINRFLQIRSVYSKQVVQDLNMMLDHWQSFLIISI
ncbi:MAG: hypothetical protein AAF696_22470 [Bacteroidota bacterium]